MLEDEVEPEAGVSDGQALVAQKTRERLWRVLNTENSNGILGLEEHLHSIRINQEELTLGVSTVETNRDRERP
jgi:hypothetical protein